MLRGHATHVSIGRSALVEALVPGGHATHSAPTVQRWRPVPAAHVPGAMALSGLAQNSHVPPRTLDGKLETAPTKSAGQATQKVLQRAA